MNEPMSSYASDPRFPGPDPYAPLRDLPDFPLTSTDFGCGDAIPDTYVAPANVSPQLAWSGLPEGTKSIAVTMFDPDAPTATPQYFDLSPQDLATVTAQAEQGSRKAAKRLTEYYQFSAYGLPDLPEDEREAKAEYWQKRAQEIQAK